MTTTAKRLILAAALLGGLTASAEADNTLYVDDFTSQTILRYDATNINSPTPINGPSNPWVSGYADDAVSCGLGREEDRRWNPRW
jgi:hypothetical protein